MRYLKLSLRALFYNKTVKYIVYMHKIANKLRKLFDLLHHSPELMLSYRAEADNLAFRASVRAEEGDMFNLSEDLSRLNDLTIAHSKDTAKSYEALNALLTSGKANEADVKKMIRLLSEQQVLNEVTSRLGNISKDVNEKREKTSRPKLSADQMHIKGTEIFERYNNDPGISADIKLRVVSKLEVALDDFRNHQFKSASNQLGATMQTCEAIIKESTPEDALVLAAFKYEVASLKMHLDSPAKAFIKIDKNTIWLN